LFGFIRRRIRGLSDNGNLFGREREGSVDSEADRREYESSEDSTIEAARRRAVAVLRHCSHPAGLKASARAYGHQQVWVRDSMITLLGGSLVDDPAIRSALLASVSSFRRHQTPAGLIPNHIDLESRSPNFRAYADGGLWYVIGSGIAAPDFRSARKVLGWYDCQDVDRSGLISVQEASDWQDLFCTRGKGLYVNCLRVIALRKAAQLAEREQKPGAAARYMAQAEAASDAINRTLWYAGDGEMLRHIAHSFSTPGPLQDSLGRRRWLPSKRILLSSEYYLPYAGFRQVGEWFDSFGNLLAILAGVADQGRSGLILDFIAQHGLAAHPMKAIYPPVEPGDPDWRDYYGTLNLPGQYHNGGIWPFLGGFYIAALVKMQRHDDAQAALLRLARLNLEGDFNEWHHGRTAEPKGVHEQAWSAGMFLYARACVTARKVWWLE
jgi:Alkaline and neutral invertase